jgi:hypothetical protein
VAVPRWSINDYAFVQQALASVIDVIHPVSQVSEIAAAGVGFFIPVPSNFDTGAGIFFGGPQIAGCSEKNQGEAPGITVVAVDFD